MLPIVNDLFALLVAGMPLLPSSLVADTGGVCLPETSVRYFRVHFANDLYQKTDRYYTGGILLQYAAPGLAGGPMRRLLPSLPDATRRTHGVELALDVFTPSDIDITEIQRGDRPYAGYLYTGHFLQADHPARGESLRTAVHVGVLGPPAAAGQLQTAIHRFIDCPSPAGWKNQVHADLVLDYQVQYRKRLLRMGQMIEAVGLAEARVGTLYDQLQAGTAVHLGKWLPRRKVWSWPGHNFRCYGTWQGQLTVVGYNATLQGGMFNRSSPYTLLPHQVSRVVLQQTAGAVIGWNKIGIVFGQTWVGREFHGGKPHCWNHLTVRIHEL